MTSQENILVIDDDREMLETVEFCLLEAGYTVATVIDGQQAIEIFNNNHFDLVIVDLRLPGVGGLDLIRTFKQQSDVAIIIVSGLGEPIDKIIGLEVGADDYMGKPFELRELLARVRSVIRRAQGGDREKSSETRVLLFDGWKCDLLSRCLSAPGGTEVALTSGEFDLLRVLLENSNRVLDRDQLLEHTHQANTPAFDRSIDVQIGRIRKKIEENPQKPQFIKTIRNAGYMFAAKVTQV
ncbi:MAG: response regulator transcription factor [Rhodospirillales bacterium]|nr:response regulator transcription factor [Rhodospirillales bacterium]